MATSSTPESSSATSARETEFRNNTTNGARASKGAARDAVDAQHQRFGGTKWGAAFFGWLSANGLAVLLIALVSAAGVAIGLTQGVPSAGEATSNAGGIGIGGAIALLVVLGAVAGAKYNVLSQLNLPRIPVDEGTATTAGIIALVAVLVVTLIGAVLGGKLGERFHRKVDRAGFTAA
jgi:hypothetical protein